MDYSNNNNVYYCDSTLLEVFKFYLDKFLSDKTIIDTTEWHSTRKRNYGNVSYLNAPISFDIETSSCYIDKFNQKEKFATMYIWQFGIRGVVILGRTWEQFFYMLKQLQKYFGTDLNNRIIIYVHNLGFEFQFIRKHLEWQEVFAPKKRRPLIALTKDGIEFRCSYLLSNYALANVPLHKYTIEKMVGDLDYKLIRTSLTPITPKELGYCINDVRVVMSYIQEKIEQEGSIVNIPLTNTGNVRRFVRNRVFGNSSCLTPNESKIIRRRYNDLMNNLRITSVDEYDQLKRAFAGGFTHAGVYYSRQILEEEIDGVIGSMDLSSSYPFVCVAEYFPMSGVYKYYKSVDSDEEFKRLCNKYCCVFDIEVDDLKPIFEYENMLSASKCFFKGKHTENNGRVIRADHVATTMTELDFDTFEKFYTFKNLKVCNMRCYKRGYLPRDLVLSILDLYEAKTTLKGVEGAEIQYMVSKNMINATFGMMVTNIVRDYEDYDGEWIERKVNTEESVSQLTDYNNSFSRFLFYAWGVYVTAHARHNLFSAILEFGEDFVYADTDSIKGLNFEKHMPWIRNYNNSVFMKLFKVCMHYKISFSKVQPKTKLGVRKRIGVWELEDSYSKFKTIGAKRYIYEYKKNGELGLTCAGINKKAALKYLLEQSNGSNYVAMVMFDWGVYFPPGCGGKNTVAYIDTPLSAWVEDYQGRRFFCEEKSFVHIEESSYYLSLTKEYLDLISGKATASY